VYDREVDVAVVGAGPAGSVLAYELARAGMSVLGIEREEFPRFHIGESLTGTGGEIVRRLHLEDEMAERDFPEKPGVTVIGQEARSEFFVPVLNPTWQVRRSSFDEMLRDAACRAGASMELGKAGSPIRDGTRVTGVEYVPEGSATTVRVRARAVVDASGQSAWLSRQGVAGTRVIQPRFAKQIAVFSHFEDVERDPGDMGQVTTIFYSKINHWAWIIPISSTVDSIGIVIPTDAYQGAGRSPQDALDWGIRSINPELRRRLEKARQVESVMACRDYSYEVTPFVGDGWLCIGDSHRFIDPIFSFGVSFGMTEAIEAARAIADSLQDKGSADPLREYARWSDFGQEVASDVIQGFWRHPVFFGYRMRDPDFKRSIIRLFGGQCFPPQSEVTAALVRSTLGTSAHAA
jgi:1H-pyrrole-2-carbonyl-[peptidyl-carrier protein] brominase